MATAFGTGWQYCANGGLAADTESVNGNMDDSGVCRYGDSDSVSSRCIPEVVQEKQNCS